MYTIKLDDIPRGLLPALCTNRQATIWLHGCKKVKHIWLDSRMRYRLITDMGEYRYGIDTDIEINVQEHI